MKTNRQSVLGEDLCHRRRGELGRLLASALLLWQASGLRAADVGVSIRLDADWVELIRAQRRAQGIDTPDAQADARVAALLQRAQQRHVKTAAPLPHGTHHGAITLNRPFWIVSY